MKKKLLVFAALAGVLCLMAYPGEAADPDTMTLSVTVSASLSVAISGDPYDFETVSLNTTTMSTRAITITNDSTEAIEDVLLSCTPPGGWTASADLTNGANEFVLEAVFNSTQPTEADFDATALDVVDSSPQRADATHFAFGQDGDELATSEAVNIWFFLETPESSSLSGAQNITFTVDAELAD